MRAGRQAGRAARLLSRRSNGIKLTPLNAGRADKRRCAGARRLRQHQEAFKALAIIHP